MRQNVLIILIAFVIVGAISIVDIRPHMARVVVAYGGTAP